MRLPGEDDTRRRQRTAGSTVQTATENKGIDLFDFEYGMGRRRDANREGWITPPVQEGADAKTGDIRIREAGPVGGFTTPSGRHRVIIERKIDGEWRRPISEEQATEWLGMLETRSQAQGSQQSTEAAAPREPRQSQEPQQSRDPDGEVQWDRETEERFERVMRRMRDLGDSGRFSRFNTVRLWQRENGYKADGRLTNRQYDEIMQQYNEWRR